MSDLGVELRGGPFKTSTTTNIDGGNDILLRRGRVGNNVAHMRVAMSKDEAVLAGFGKKQQLKRRFKYVSTVGLTCGLLVSWVGLLNALQIGLANGGPAGLIYGMLGTIAGAMLQALVLGEITSMIPIAGGAFNWVSILAPPKSRRFMSYIAGWYTVVTYQLYVLTTAYTNGSIIQGLIILNYPDYVPQLWHPTLISYAVVLFGLFLNTYLGRVLPQIESILLLFLFLGYVAVLIPIVYLSPHRSASDVFLTFQNLDGWSSDGVAFLVGWLASFGNFLGADGADHIAEEVTSAQVVIPFAMWFATLLNGTMALGMLIAVMFVTDDYVAAAQPTTGFAVIDIFAASLRSTNGANALVAVTLVANILSISSCIATASRALWAFARENGVPGSKFVSKISPKTRLPINAICITVLVEMVIVLISVGSSTAFAAFSSMAISAYYTTFLIAAWTMLYKRLTTPSSEIPWGPFQLGKFGVPITIAAIIYTTVTLVFSFFPQVVPATAGNMNYAVVVYGAAVVIMLLFWMIHGRKAYVGPIWEFEGEFVRKN